jgi:hypothetical protein
VAQRRPDEVEELPLQPRLGVGVGEGDLVAQVDRDDGDVEVGPQELREARLGGLRREQQLGDDDPGKLALQVIERALQLEQDALEAIVSLLRLVSEASGTSSLRERYSSPA